MSTLFKDVLCLVREDAHEKKSGEARWGPAVLQFLDRWGELDDYSLLDGIADDGKKVGRARRLTCYQIIETACTNILALDPKAGLASPLGLEQHRQFIDEYKRLAECAGELAKYCRSIQSDVCVIAEEEARLRFYEGEAETFRQLAISMEETLPRQLHSAKRKDAWARRAFVRSVARFMHKQFEKRYSRAIAVITDVAFPPAEGLETTAIEVDDICRSETR